MSISMALFSPPVFSSLQNPNFIPKSSLSLLSAKRFSLLSIPRASPDNGTTSPATASGAATAVETSKHAAAATAAAPPAEEVPPPQTGENSGKDNGAAGGAEAKETVSKFQDARWISGTWDLKQFVKDGKTDWDAVIDAEAKRRKWLENNPETTSNQDPVVFDTSIIPWWAWVKRYHLPEAELLNGRAAMIGFFMAYFVDSLTGVGLVDQMGNFFCKTLLLLAVAGVLLIRKNEDLENLKKLFEETTFYDKQWQAAWKDENPTDSKNKYDE